MRAAESVLVAQRASGALGVFSAAGVLGVADVHTATAVCRMGGESDESVALAIALTVRALRMGSVCIDLTAVHTQVLETGESEAADPVDLAALPWPEPTTWLDACSRSRVVAESAGAAEGRPLRLADGMLYLERYWQQEEQVRREVAGRLTREPPQIDVARMTAGLDRLFTGEGLGADEADLQKVAAAVAGSSWLSVVAGGPGTGKTTTVARLLALLRDQQPDNPPRIALAAPTGKAAARLAEAVTTAALGLVPSDRGPIGELSASTLHRLLGWQPGSRGRFAHNAGNHLPYEVVVVDEVSMVALTMMARLLEAVGPATRLVLVGDPDQLSSVEAGAVLADITKASGVPERRLGERLTSVGVIATPEQAPVHSVVRLKHIWRFGGAIGELAEAVRRGDPDAAIDILRAGDDAVRFVESDLAVGRPAGLEPLIQQVHGQGVAIRSAAQSGRADDAVRALGRHRLLCAHRTGPYGQNRWSGEVERWLAEVGAGRSVADPSQGEWYVGRPVLVTTNDYELGLYNGDTGIVVNTSSGPRVAFPRGSDAYMLVAPVRLDSVLTVHAMTVHRAQGSQFDCVSFVVPPPASPLLTRELLYTAISRAMTTVQVFGTEEAVRRAIQRRANRASGLQHRLDRLAAERYED